MTDSEKAVSGRADQLPPAAELLEAMPDPVLIVDAGRHLVAANAAATATFGVTQIGRDLTVSVRHPDVLQAVDTVLQDGACPEITIDLAAPVRRSFGLSVTPLRQAARERLLMLLFRDITVTARAEQIRADLVANVSHELRSPLSSLFGFIETLKGPAHDDTAAQKRFLDIMEGEAARMTNLIDDLLSLSRVEVNEHVPPSEPVDLQPIIARTLDTLRGAAQHKNMAIRIDAAGELQPVAGDVGELRQVFQNLVDNAVKYGRSDTEIEIALRPVPRMRETGARGIMVEIRDYGDGIAPEHLPRLTERFYRVDKGRSRSLGGTGLGLAIVKHIVSRHRGYLTVESTPGEGSTFAVVLPEFPPS